MTEIKLTDQSHITFNPLLIFSLLQLSDSTGDDQISWRRSELPVLSSSLTAVTLTRKSSMIIAFSQGDGLPTSSISEGTAAPPPAHINALSHIYFLSLLEKHSFTNQNRKACQCIYMFNKIDKMYLKRYLVIKCNLYNGSTWRSTFIQSNRLNKYLMKVCQNLSKCSNNHHVRGSSPLSYLGYVCCWDNVCNSLNWFCM